MSISSIAILTLSFLPDQGGQEEYIFQLAQQLAKDFQVTVITSVGGVLPTETRFKRIVVSRATPIGFLKQIIAVRPDKILVGHAHPRILLPARLWGNYATLTYGNDFLAAQLRWHRPLFNRLLAGSKPLITITQAMSTRLKNLGLPAPVIVLPGTNPARFTPRQADLPAPVLLTVCRLVSRKGIDTVLFCLPKLLASIPNLVYRIGGQGPDRIRLEALAERLGVSHAVEFLGFIPDDELPALYRNASVFVMSSREEPEVGSVEGFGIVYLEASASGVPVVAANSGGAAEAVRAGKTGLLVPPNDPDALSDALLQLLSNPELCHQMGQAGRNWVETDMNWERAGMELKGFIQ